jgi:CubicO group peptidase (beta-lactamase class C family)
MAIAAPDEDKLGKANGYPVGTQENYFYEESVGVGSFSNLDKINFRALSLAPLRASPLPMPLPKAANTPNFRWFLDGRYYGVDDYLDRQRIMGLMIVKNGEVLVERYQYERKPEQRFVSHSMAKSIASLAFGFALQEGLLASLDERADALAPELKGTLYGEATVRQLLRMSSGVKFAEVYNGKDDLARFGAEAAARGIPAAARLITEREAPAGNQFKYASSETAILSQVFQSVAKQDLAAYLTTRLWQPIGAASDALWIKNKFGVISAGGGFNATLADYARLGIVLAHDGMRPDTRQQVIPKDYLLEATDWKRHPKAFHPLVATPYHGYGYQFWLFPSEKRRFALLGVYGQMIFVDPELKLVMVQTAANASARAGATSLGREADAFWRGLVLHYGKWN